MITLIHGDNTAASRAELDRLRTAATGKEIRTLDGKTADAALLTQSLQSTSLFGGDTVVIIEGLFSPILKKPTLVKERAGIVMAHSAAIDVILWEDREMGKTVVNELGSQTAVRVFALPKTLFQFLDTVSPRNARQLLTLYEKTIATEAPELVHNLLVKRIRQLIMLADGTKPPGMSAWQLERLTKQTKLFTITRLLSMYQNLSDIEYAVKSGATPFRLSQLTEQLILTL